MMGCATVAIGEAGASGVVPGAAGITMSPNISVQGTPQFMSEVMADLSVLAATKTGRSILDAIANGKHKVTLKELDMATAQKNGALAGPKDRSGAKDPKKGSDTTIRYNPNLRDKYTDQNGKKVDVPVQATLGHELIHAVHNDQGVNERDKPDPKEVGSNQEESKTIGINDHAGNAMTENNLLKDMKAGYQRTDHDESVVTP